MKQYKINEDLLLAVHQRGMLSERAVKDLTAKHGFIMRECIDGDYVKASDVKAEIAREVAKYRTKGSIALELMNSLSWNFIITCMQGTTWSTDHEMLKIVVDMRQKYAELMLNAAFPEIEIPPDAVVQNPGLSATIGLVPSTTEPV